MHRLKMFLEIAAKGRWSRVVVLFVAIFILLGGMSVVRMRLLSSGRALASAESLYSKAQKDAVFYLFQYATSGAEPDFQLFQRAISVPLGDRKARLELEKQHPDLDVVREDLLDGGNNTDDIADMIDAYRIFRHVNISIEPISMWTSADNQLIELNIAASRLHSLVQGGAPDLAEVKGSLDRIRQINLRLVQTEGTLSSSIGGAIRKIQHVLLSASWIIAVIVLFCGALVARLILTKNGDLENALQVSEERLHLAMVGSNDGLWDWNIVQGRVYYSPRLRELLGYSGPDLLAAAAHFERFVYPDDLAMTRAKLDAHLRDNIPYDVEYRVINQIGGLRWVRSRAQSLRDSGGEPLRMTGSITDITDRKHAEEQLYAEKERAQVTLESIGDAVVTVNIDGLIDYLNPAAAALTGWTLVDAHGLAMASICPMLNEITREKIPDLASQILSSDRASDVTTNILLVCRDGHEIAVNWSAAPIGNREGKIIGIVFVFHDVSKDRAYATHLSFQASHDELTGLINRREFERRLELLLPVEQSKTKHHTMLYLDIDQFKIVNDTCGHIAGDEMLKQLGILLKAKLRQNDTLARLGGDEFGVLLETCPIEPALRVAELFRQAVSNFRFVWQEKIFSIGVSIGLVAFSNDGATLADILRMADAACYVAKDKGRNRIHIFTPEDKELAQRHGEMGWIGRIQKALEEQRFVLYSQKIRALGNDPEEGEHYEILLRMLDENGQLVPPMAFIPAAERYGLMPSLDRWVIKTAFSEYATRHPGETVSGTCAINLSGTSISDDDFLPFVRAQFQHYQVPPSGICFEITETSAIANLGKAEGLIRDLKKLGCRISLDDFGSGMSSFSYLKHLSVDYLKIDGGFVKDMMSDPIDHAMVEAINRIGHVMKIKTIAEFVENNEIMEELRLMGIDFAQGYGVEKPRPCVISSV
jgi:diguanylate cyclase (GGDEF)-like protein/PAS domain S-box-containing protein